MGWSRRSFLKQCALVTTGAALGSIEYSRAAHDTSDLEFIEATVHVRDLPADLRGYRIGLISDVHLGVWVPQEWFDAAIEKLRSAKPDLIVFGGDYLWVPDDNLIRAFGFVRNKKYADLPYPAAADAIFADFAQTVRGIRAPDGIYGILGNHDRWVDPTACFRHLTPDVMTLLVNQGATVKRGASTLRIWGADDYLTGAPTLPNFSREPGTIELFLSHNPDFVSYAIRNGRYDFDLALCGHTHGGQVKILGLSALTYAVEDQRFSSGMCVIGHQTVYTTRGIGIVELPYRLHCRPETTLITLA